jgi:D-tyrosyl-tRNA(Tyr) deacylase
MRALLQRVSKAQVKVDDQVTGKIEQGLLLFLGIGSDDTIATDGKWICKKMLNMRIFNDEEGQMNRSVTDIGGGILVVSQFTLHASTKKGNRPSYMRAASPRLAQERYDAFVSYLRSVTELPVATGRFGANMQVELTNDGPVTIWLDSEQKE